MSGHQAAADPWTDPAGTRLVGDPVDVVTGRVTERTLCFRLIGPLFLEWDRHYDSGHTALARGFGLGHAHSYDHRLSFDADGLRLEEPVGRYTGFPALLSDGDAHTARGVTLQRISLFSYHLTRPGSPALEFAFAHPERPARIARVSRGNAAIRFHFGREGHLLGLVHSTGLRITTKEDDDHRLLSLSGAWDGGRKERPILVCEYDTAGDLVGMTDALGRRSSFAYDTAHRLVRRTDRSGYKWLFEYDAAGRCVRSAGEDGVFGVTLRYLTDERKTEVSRSDGGLWKYHYDDTGWITHVIGPYGDVRQFVKGESGRTIAEVDALGHQLEYMFDVGGALVGKRFATGRVIRIEADFELDDPPPHRAADRPLQYLYGDLVTRLPVASEGLAAVSAELRRALPLKLEARPASPVVPPFSNLPWYPEPSEGREFTPFGHLVHQVLPGGGARRWTYDANDGMDVYTDADGAITRQERRSCDPLTTLIDPLGAETHYRYTAEERIVAVTDPGGTMTEFARDREGRLLGVRRAGELRETYRRDSAGNLVEKRDGAGATLLILRPTNDRLVAERRLASGGVHRFAYNADGRFVSASVDASEVRFAYDEFGRRILDTRDGLGVAHDFAAGPGREITAVLDRFVITRELDGARLNIRLPGGAWLRVERLGPRALLRSCSNGSKELCQFDEMGRLLVNVIAAASETGRRWLRRWHYTAEGDLLEFEDSLRGTTRYRYDAAHRLTEAARKTGEAETYVHDPAGNLLAQPGLSGVLLGIGNRLSSANGERFSYDLRHHIGERHGPAGTVRYRYDSRDMLVSVERVDGVWQAEYDAIGRRVRIRQGEAEHRFFWDTDRLAAELFPSGQLRIYVYPDPLALTPLAFVDYPHIDGDPAAGAVHFVFADQRGAPVLVQDTTGNVAWEAQLSPYGAAVVTAANGLGLNMRFPGHYFDATTGLHYNRFRYYDPVLGRYIQSDPIGIGGGLNVYAYPANPLVQIDVRGLNEPGGSGCPNKKPEEKPPEDPNAEKDGKPTPPPGDGNEAAAPAGGWPPPRTEKAQKECQKVVDTMEQLGMSKKSNGAVDVLTHENGTVSVGISGGDTDRNRAAAARLQEGLNGGDPNGPYRVSAVSNVPDIHEVPGGNMPGVCAEPHAATAANGNPSPIDGHDTRWRGKGDNPHPFTGQNAGDPPAPVHPSQMNPCPTCADDHNNQAYGDHANGGAT